MDEMNEWARLVILEQRSRQSTTCFTGQPDYCERTTRFRAACCFFSLLSSMKQIERERERKKKKTSDGCMRVHLCPPNYAYAHLPARECVAMRILAAMLHSLEKSGIIPSIWWHNSNKWASISFANVSNTYKWWIVHVLLICVWHALSSLHAQFWTS